MSAQQIAVILENNPNLKAFMQEAIELSPEQIITLYSAFSTSNN